MTSISAISARIWKTRSGCCRLDIESPTLKRQVFKRLAYKYLCDVRQEVKDRIATEIDESFERA